MKCKYYYALYRLIYDKNINIAFYADGILFGGMIQINVVFPFAKHQKEDLPGFCIRYYYIL
ncbi:MAG: hypothetical protein V1773_13245 [bacterium]